MKWKHFDDPMLANAPAASAPGDNPGGGAKSSLIRLVGLGRKVGAGHVSAFCPPVLRGAGGLDRMGRAPRVISGCSSPPA